MFMDKFPTTKHLKRKAGLFVCTEFAVFQELVLKVDKWGKRLGAGSWIKKMMLKGVKGCHGSWVT